MVFENLIPVRFAEQKPLRIFPIIFLFATIAIFLALWIFPSHAAIVAVFLTTLACMPFMIKIIGFEKEKEEKTKDYIKQLVFSFFKGIRNIKFKSISIKEPRDKLIALFIILFLSLSLAFAFWFVVLPNELITNLFYIQLNTIREINLAVTGNSILAGYFSKILLNNIKVLAFCVLFSFIYGAGAIFILVWNASVIGVAIGNTIRSAMAAKMAAASIIGYSGIVSASLMRYLTHGVPEILAYFIGGLAGSMISIAVLKQEKSSERFNNTLYHASCLILLSITILIFSALIEISISPLIPI